MLLRPEDMAKHWNHDHGVNNIRGPPGGSEVKASACNAGDLNSIPGSGRSSGEGNGKPLQYSCLENPMDREVWHPTVHGVMESDTTEVTKHVRSHTYWEFPS